MNSENNKPLPVNDKNFLTADWLSDILSNYYASPCSVSTFEFDSGWLKEGFLSEIVCISVTFKVKNKVRKSSFVVKFFPKSPEVKQFMIGGNLADREVHFYQFAQSEEFKTVVSKSPSSSYVIPDVLYSEVDESSLTLVMNNLKELGYKTIVIKDGSSLKQTLKIFSSLAVVHATGMFYQQKHGKFPIKRYTDTSFYDQFLAPNLKRLIEIYKDDPLSATFKKLIPLQYIIRTYVLEQSHLFETVLHGDLWAGQCMFSGDEDDVCILDWQFANIGSPIIDLMAMFFMSSDPNILENNLDEMLKYYWDELIKNLQANSISFSIKYVEFLESVEKYWMVGFMYIVVSLHDFFDNDIISYKRLKGLMSFLHNRNVFKTFIDQYSENSL